MGGATTLVLNRSNNEDSFTLVACTLPSAIDALLAVRSLVVALGYELGG